MKFAIFFVFAAAAILAQANANVVVDGSADRGAIVDALKGKLAEAKQKLDELLLKASDTLKAKIAELAKQAENLLAEFKLKATRVSDKVYADAQKVLEKVGYYEDRVVEEAQKIVLKNKQQQNGY